MKRIGGCSKTVTYWILTLGVHICLLFELVDVCIMYARMFVFVQEQTMFQYGVI